MTDSGIYAIRNRANDKRYVGSAVDLEWRWQGEHLDDLRRGQSHNRHLQNAFNKYGEEAFEFIVLEYVDDPEMLIPREQHYIDEVWPECYNICPKAGSSLGMTQSEETRRKNSEAHRGKHPSEETRRKLSESWTSERRRQFSEARGGHLTSEETRRKISEARRGHSMSEETRRKLSESVRQFWTPRRRKGQSERMKRLWATKQITQYGEVKSE